MEEWRVIPGFPGYEASSFGRIRSLKTHNGVTGRILSQSKNGHGYFQVGPYANGQINISKVHRLVALAFHGPCPPGLETRHLDGNRLNNRPENLRYGTHSENGQDMVRHGEHNQARKTHCLRGHEFTSENTAYRPNRKERICRTCHRNHSARYRARQAA